MIKSVLRKLPKLIFTNKFLFVICLLTIVFTGIAKAGTFTGESFQNALSKPGTSKEKFDTQSFTDLISAGNCTIIGCKEISGDFKKGALGSTGDMVAMLYNPPASGVQYVADVIGKFGIVQPAYAQTGVGFTNLNAILPIWRIFRDFTYLFFVIILVVTGFGIMFRWKLNPQTVVTIQSALPRVIIALVLVTFSYAISGLLIDFLYVLIAIPAMLLGSIWNPANAQAGTQSLQDQFLRGNFFDLVGALWGQVGQDNAIRIGVTSGGLVGSIAGLLGSLGGGPVGLAVGVLVGFAAGGLVGTALVALIVSIIILIQLFRLFFALLQNYIAIILLIILGPLQIALGVIPGMPGFGGWFKSLVANILGFVGVAVVLMLGMVISQSVSTNGLWEPPFLPGFVAGTANGLIGFGILLVIHQVPQLIKNALGVRGLGINPQEGFRPITGALAENFGTQHQNMVRAAQSTAGGARWNTGLPQSLLSQLFRNAGGR